MLNRLLIRTIINAARRRLDIEEFEEGTLPRKLFQVTLRKK
jgi:hypothetical protein